MAVYTHITAEDLKEYLSGFDIGEPVSFTGITEGIDNTNYLVTTAQGKFILTLFEKRINPDDLPFFLSFMNHLRDKGIPCPRVIATRKGETVLRLKDRPAAITTFLPGSGGEKTNEDHIPALGGLLARMHMAGQDFNMRRENSMRFAAWKMRIDACGSETDELMPDLSTLLHEELSWQNQYAPSGLPTGAVHADVFPDNVFFSGSEITGVIDFYFSCTDSFAYDLMIAINAWCFDDGSFNKGRYQALIAAYEKHRPLSAPEKSALPALGRAAALRIISTRLYDWLHPVPGADVRLKDPLEYVKTLKFYQSGDFSA